MDDFEIMYGDGPDDECDGDGYEMATFSELIEAGYFDEPGTDVDFDRYAVEVQNGDGYYDIFGHFHRYLED